VASNCDICKEARETETCYFKQNVSYFFERRESEFCGKLCHSCMNKVFLKHTLITLFGTWWGVVGMFLGPAFIFHNITEYIVMSFKFWRRKKSVDYEA